MPMSTFFKKIKKPTIDPLSDRDIESVVKFCKPAFGFSEWITRGGKKEHYYFNVDKFYSDTNHQVAIDFHNTLAAFVRNVAKGFNDLLNNQEPVLAYLCQDGGPRGIVQARGVLAERLAYHSVLVYPNRRLLRARVVSDQNTENFPTSVQWLLDKNVLLLTDTATTGESIARAVSVLRAFGCQPLAAIAVYDRDQGAEESLQTVRVPLYSIFGPKQASKFGSFQEESRQFMDTPIKEIISFATIAARSG